MCQWALTERQTLGSGGALQRGHSASLEPLAQRNDALSGGKELVILVVIPTKVVALQTASAGKEAAWRAENCQLALTQRRSLVVVANRERDGASRGCAKGGS